MPKPLHSEQLNPTSNQFNSMLLDTGKQSRGSVATATTLMVAAAALFFLYGLFNIDTLTPKANDMTALAPPPPPPPPPPPVKPPPPPPPPPPPKVDVPPPPPPEKAVVKVEPPAPPSPPPPPPPRAHQPPPPPPLALTANKRVVTSTPLPIAAATTVQGHRNPIVNQATGPDTLSTATRKPPPSNAPVDMLATTTVTRKTPGTAVGNGPDLGLATSRSTRSTTGYGNGPPTSALITSSNRKAPPGGTGIGMDPSVPVGAKRTIATPPPTTSTASLAKPARPTFIPDANSYYTADAKNNHIAGSIVVSIRVLASGAVQVLGLQGAGLGHGLNEAALAVAKGTRCSPALDVSGHAIDSVTTMTVRFQTAGIE